MTDSIHEIQELAGRYCDGLLTDSGAERLHELLEQQPESQRHFLRVMSLHARLQWTCAERRDVHDASEFPPLPDWKDAIREACVTQADAHTTTVRQISRPAIWSAGVVGTSLIAAIAFFVFNTLSPQQGTATAQVARILKVDHAVDATGRHWEAGDILTEPKIELSSGFAEVETLAGAVLLLEAPVKLMLEPLRPLNAFLESGSVYATVPHQAIGFTIETSDAKVVDLGTGFGVSCDPETGTGIQVYFGEVIADTRVGGTPERLMSGQAMTVGHGKFAKLERTPFNPYQFMISLPDPWHPDAPGDTERRKVTPYNDVRFDSVHIVPADDLQIKIDGDLSDWDLSGQFFVPCESPYSEFYHLKGAMLYDDKFLYVGAEVGDPFPMRSRVPPYEELPVYGSGGSVALRLSVDRAIGWPVPAAGRGTTRPLRDMQQQDYSDKLNHLTLWYYAPDQIPCLSLQYGMDLHGTRLNPSGYEGAFVAHADSMGYTMEYAIPWSLLNAQEDPPQAGDVLGCTWLAHWSGPEGRNWKGQLIDVVNPAESGWNFVNAETWGKAIYHTQGDLPPGTVKPIEVYTGSRVEGPVR